MATVSAAERRAGRLEPSTVAVLLERLAEDGHALLEGALDPAQLDAMALRLDAHAAHAALDPERLIRDCGEGQHFGHIQLGLPRDETVTAGLLSNPFIEQLAEAALGQGAFLGFFNGNTCLPDSGRQGLHSDAQWTWQTEQDARAAGQAWPHAPTQVVFQFGVRDITPDNGAAEIWPGSNQDVRWCTGDQSSLEVQQDTEQVEHSTGEAGRFAHVVVARREEGAGPERLLMPKGAIALRDPRMWHNGTNNESKLPRHMLALIYSTACLHPETGNHPDRHDRLVNFNPTALMFSERAKPSMQAGTNSSSFNVSKPIQWVGGDVDHFGNAKADNVPDSDHNGRAEHKGGPWDSGHPRVRYWCPDASTLSEVAAARQAEHGDVPEWVWGIASRCSGASARL